MLAQTPPSLARQQEAASPRKPPGLARRPLGNSCCAQVQKQIEANLGKNTFQSQEISRNVCSVVVVNRCKNIDEHPPPPMRIEWRCLRGTCLCCKRVHSTRVYLRHQLHLNIYLFIICICIYIYIYICICTCICRCMCIHICIYIYYIYIYIYRATLLSILHMRSTIARTDDNSLVGEQTSSLLLRLPDGSPSLNPAVHEPIWQYSHRALAFGDRTLIYSRRSFRQKGA